MKTFSNLQSTIQTEDIVIPAKHCILTPQNSAGSEDQTNEI